MKKPPRTLRRIFVPSSKNYRNKFSVFLLCVAISFFMWGLIKLSRVYEAPLKFKINYQNYPSDKVLIKAQDTLLTIFVKARGLELYSRMFSPDKNVVNIDLSGMHLRKEGENFYGYVRSSRFLKSISSQLPMENSLIGVEPDTLSLVFGQEFRKRVPVSENLSLSFEPQHQLYDSIKLSPDSVTIFGLKPIIDTVYSIKTEKMVIKNLKMSRLIALKLEKPKTNPPITLSTDTVTAEITVDRFTEADVEVQIINQENEDVKFRTFPDKVTLTCRVAMKEYERLDPSLFAVSINHKEATASGNNLAEVKVLRQPGFARVIRIEPAKVEFLILK